MARLAATTHSLGTLGLARREINECTAVSVLDTVCWNTLRLVEATHYQYWPLFQRPSNETISRELKAIFKFPSLGINLNQVQLWSSHQLIRLQGKTVQTWPGALLAVLGPLSASSIPQLTSGYILALLQQEYCSYIGQYIRDSPTTILHKQFKSYKHRGFQPSPEKSLTRNSDKTAAIIYYSIMAVPFSLTENP